MKKSLYLSISSITILSSLLVTPSVHAQDFKNIDDAKQSHPNAQFKVNPSDGSFTYTYGQSQKQQPNSQSQQQNINRQQRNTSDNAPKADTPQQTLPDSRTTNEPTPQQPSPNQQTPNDSSSQTPDSSTEEQPASSNDMQQPETPQPETPQPETPPTQPDTSNENNTNQQVGDVDKAYEKDDNGMITSIDLDILNDELQISEFNEKAKTVDGKPLALGNGKIINQPTFTNKNNLYTAGQCTWYVFDKRAQDARTISTFWGDAKHWAGQASAAGFKVDNKPEKGAILQTVAGAYGHVAYVENVNSDGSLLVSEMNWVGPYIISTRTISASEAGTYNYIH
ncbi:CHAP domain-containing protein [Mammaliicoccus sp. Dog046]|uniref:CHAP domain-containing protein n=1 Tax=Mammaliicoccus sp. Dog046 TaxID=3034233 RepID=UPI002B259C9E|nr:CHAP domain-containing protein [Mammaliicoccus sp. Dog046]WQK85578.1 CHAP domain-containing protein [Mammaliicoccus sp. Dog046]